MAVAGPIAPQGLQLQGDRQAGQDVRTQNVTAVAAIANIVRTSLGPVGLDKVSAPSGCLCLDYAAGIGTETKACSFCSLAEHKRGAAIETEYANQLSNQLRNSSIN